MHELTEIIEKDMKPALGVTEPGAIAFCASKARSLIGGELEHLSVAMNSGMYKNAFSCGIPNSDKVGNVFAAALGYTAGDPEKGLESLADVTPEDNAEAQRYIDEGRVSVSMSGITSRIFIRSRLVTSAGTAEVTIRDSHTNITKIVVNGETVLETEAEQACDTTEADAAAETHAIHRYTLAQLLEYVDTVPLEEISFVKKAYEVNLELFCEGMDSERTTFARRLLAMNGGKVISDNEERTASLLCNAAIEARVIGLDKPAMSITGSGAHGIIATLPLYAVYRIEGLTEEQLCRATMLSYLVCTYIKEYSGRLSAFCGCGIAAGTGMAAAVCWLKGGGLEEITYVINNMASSVTGMICDGGNQGCTMKGIAACAAAFESVELALGGVYVDSVHGINGLTPEDTMRNMGLIASPGMVETEKTIVEIQESKR
ncbi:MAG: L-serine ammonia-lyase, iron-sulfur-dependent, subunit alpha [Anaerovoracaceae bacterium]|nr:L-serine ammonia-lyase, iron-sulfur-dependent, subunit alpha [Bacillota bacterium]MDY2670968.1 L-serine ammonia-lyase, iron-sulfur-dependent, subunit alpha [Anaerovoracaceae bacterium]